MCTTARLNHFRKSPWGLALILPLLLIPLTTHLSVRLWVLEGYVYLIYLPLAVMIALMLVYDWGALPGITLGLSYYYFNRYAPEPASIIIGIYLIVLAAGWSGYRLQARRRWCVDYGELRLMPVRLFWLVFFIPTLFGLMMQIVAASGLMPLKGSVFSRDLLSLHTLLNLQSVMLSSVTMVQICYLFIRGLRKPAFFRMIFLRIQRQAAAGVSRIEYLAWLCLLVFLLAMLMQLDATQRNLLSTDYGLPLLLPLMLWAAVRFGYLFTALSWALLLMVLYQLRDRFLHPYTDPYHLAVMSANLLIFSMTILLMAAVSTQQRRALNRTKKAALNDPVMGLPNLRALSLALANSSRSTLCFMTIPELDRLSRTYGLRLRIQYKRSLANHLRPLLRAGEDIYQLPGFDLVVRLEDDNHLTRIESIAVRLQDYRLSWDGLPVHLKVGLSYCHIRPPVSHLYELLGEMSGMAEASLTSGVAENLQQNISLPVQFRISKKIALLNDIQLALTSNSFTLMAERACGARGDDYYHLQLYLNDSYGEKVEFERLYPIVNEFGLNWQLDQWVIRHTLGFIDAHRGTLPGIRFAINLFAASLCRPGLVTEIETLLHEFQVEPWQLIFAIEELPVLTDYSWGNRAIAQLRALGCRIVIDDFGQGYNSYVRLKETQVDMLKIDGSFVRNMLNSSLDYQIIEATCVIARSKKMQVIVCCVESAEADILLRKLGVDYLQGRLYGEPCQLESLAPASNN